MYYNKAVGQCLVRLTTIYQMTCSGNCCYVLKLSYLFNVMHLLLSGLLTLSCFTARTVRTRQVTISLMPVYVFIFLSSFAQKYNGTCCLSDAAVAVAS